MLLHLQSTIYKINRLSFYTEANVVLKWIISKTINIQSQIQSNSKSL
jgi:hypothetical protein